MTTVARRTFRSTPARDALATWIAIVDLLTRGTDGAARTELLAVAGIAASIIADHAPREAPIVVTCDGPRTRIYCLYDDDAIDGSDSNEDPLGFDPLKGDWRASLPSPVDDLSWVQAALKGHSDRITARDPDTPVAKDQSSKAADTQTLVLEPKRISRIMTSVAVNTYAFSVTYVADNILKSMKDIIRLSGLDPTNLVGELGEQDAGNSDLAPLRTSRDRGSRNLRPKYERTRRPMGHRRDLHHGAGRRRLLDRH